MNQEDLVQWIEPDKIERASGPSIKLVKVRASAPVKGFFVSDAVVGVKTHWLGGRTKPCFGTVNGCESCARGESIRAKGYIGVVTSNTMQVYLLEVTEKAFDAELRLSATSGLRGCYFEARRTGKADNSGLVIEVFDNKKPAKELPPDIDIRAVLYRIWFGRETKNRRNET